MCTRVSVFVYVCVAHPVSGPISTVGKRLLEPDCLGSDLMSCEPWGNLHPLCL